MAIQLQSQTYMSSSSIFMHHLPPPSHSDSYSIRPMWLHLSPANPAGKWLGFVTAVWVSSVSGANYSFSNYSQALKIIMNLTQLQLNNLSVAKDVGVVFGLLAGISSDRLPTPVLLLIGSIGGFISYGGQWLVISRTIQPPPYWVMCIFMCLGGNSVQWLNTAVMVTCFRNFRDNRGPVSGILKGFVGLSTAIFTDFYAALFTDSVSTYLLMLAIVPFVGCLAAMLFLREIPRSSTAESEREEIRYLGVFNIIAVAVAVYLLAFDLSGTHGQALSIAFAVTLLILLASPLLIPLYVALRNSKKSTSTSSLYIESEVATPLLADSGEESNPDTGAAVVVEVKWKRRSEIGEDHTIWEALGKVDFWVLFASFLCGVGPGTTVSNNLGQMAVAFGYTDVSIFVSLFSVGGFFGRISSGWVSELFIKKSGTPRPLWNAASHIMMCVGFISMALAVPGSLYIGSVVVGLCHGALFVVTSAIASELFGLKNCGLIFNIVVLSTPLGSFLFSGLIAGFLYDSQATSTAGGGDTCLGDHCYRLVYTVMVMACLIGFGLDVLVALRSKNVYARLCACNKSKKARAASNAND